MTMDRTSPQATAEVFERLVPDPAGRKAASHVMARLIEHAHSHGREAWSVTLRRRRVRLNVGNIFVADIDRSALWIVVDPAVLTDAQRNELLAAEIKLHEGTYRMFPTLLLAETPFAMVEAVWPVVQDAALAAIDAAAHWGKCPFRNAYSPGIVSYLRATSSLGVEPAVAPLAPASELGVLLARSYASANLTYTSDQIACFFTALQVKGFVVLSGISGTGKSKLAQHFVRALGEVASADSDDGDRVRIKVKPYMSKHGHLIVPKRFAELVSLPEIGTSIEVDVKFPGGSETCRLSHRKYTGAHYLELTFRGKARDFVRELLPKMEAFFFDPIESSDGALTGVRIEAAGSPSSKEIGAHHLFLPVRPDWRDGTELLGFYNPVTETYESRAFVEFLDEAIDAWERKDKRPFFVILDEMNLARVEYYFADLLSVMESGRRADGFTEEAITLSFPEGASTTDAPRRKLHIPPNFFVVGTINSDETTHAFSPKVLDRAFTIELNEVDFEQMYASEGSEALTAQERLVVARAFSSQGTYVRTDRKAASKLLDDHPEFRDRLQSLCELLEPYEMHFGYRVFDEVVTFLVHAHRNGLFGSKGLDDAFDAAVLMKVLPKFHGSRTKLEKPLLLALRWAMRPDDEVVAADGLETLETALAAAPIEDGIALPATASRIRRMLQSLATSGFASFG